MHSASKPKCVGKRSGKYMGVKKDCNQPSSSKQHPTPNGQQATEGTLPPVVLVRWVLGVVLMNLAIVIAQRSHNPLHFSHQNKWRPIERMWIRFAHSPHCRLERPGLIRASSPRFVELGHEQCG